MSTFEFGKRATEGYFDILPSDLDRLPDDVRYIDVREPDEFEGELGHLAAAELIPLASLSDTAKGWNRATPLLLICRSGRRSAAAAANLLRLGFSDVANLAGGMSAVRGRH